MTASQTSLLELQTAIVAKLTGDTALMAIITGVFDFGAVPDEPDEMPAFPYITIGNALELAHDGFSTPGYDTTQQLDIWTNQGGFWQCYQIFNIVQGLLNNKPLTLDTLHHVYTNYARSEPLRDPDDKTIRRLNAQYDTFAQEL
jgi:hypothetical protein